MTGPAREPVETIPVQPPDISRLDSKDFTLSYDEPADTMFIYFVGEDIEPVSVLVDPDNDVYALVVAATREVVGVQIEAFLARGIYEWPEFLTLAIWAGIPSNRLEPAMLEIAERAASRDEHCDVQRRFFDLSVKDQIDRFFHASEDRGIAATA